MTATVVLSWDDVNAAVAVGSSRAERAARRGYTRGVHSEVPSIDRHLHGAAAEIAVARYTGREWIDDLDAFRTLPDVLPDLEVRRPTNPTGDLAVYVDDVLERRFVLATGEIPTFELVGWIVGTEALRIRDTVEGIWRDDDRGGWYVPRRFLRDVAELRATVPA